MLLATEAHHPPATLLVFFTHHRPCLATRDIDFFQKAKASWIAEEVVQKVYQVCELPHSPLLANYNSIVQPMFNNDPGDEKIRSMVHGWKLSIKVTL